MASTTIGNMPVSATEVNAADLIEIEQGGVSKQASAGLVFTKVSKPSTTGLLCAPDFSIPEYPDSVAGTTYAVENITTRPTSFIANLTPGESFANGNWIITGTGVSVGYYRSSITGTVKARFRVLSGTAYVGAGPAGVATTGAEWRVVSHELSSQSFVFYVNGSIEIDWFYIGDGTYTSKAYDASGNGNHGTVFGCTPVQGINGTALSGDGINDYVSFGDVAKITGALTIAVPVKANVAISSGEYFIVGKWRKAGNQRQFVLYLANGLPSFIVSSDGAVISSVSAPSGLISTADFEWLTAVYIPSVGLYLYRNGALIASNTTSIPAAIFNSITPLELLRNVDTLTSYSNVTIGQPLIFNRALSADEVYQLYANKGVAVNNLVKAQTPVPTSLVVRDSSGNVEASGIKFPATQVASSDPNTLDDYEEGTFTLGVSFGGASVGVTTSTAAGRYVKIGRTVFIKGRLVLTSKGTSTGTALLIGLPFACANTDPARGVIALLLASVTFADTPIALVTQNASTIGLFETTNAGVFSSLTDADFSNTSDIRISGQYDAE